MAGRIPPTCFPAAALAVVLAPLFLASAASGTPQDFERVEAGVADVDPLTAGLRQLQLDLRMPAGFEHVYRVPGREDLFMRVNGGLYAIFPRSRYDQGRFGPVPQVPDNTIFHIGRPDADALARLLPEPLTGTGGHPRPTPAAALVTRQPGLRQVDAVDLLVDNRLDLTGTAPGHESAVPAAPSAVPARAARERPAVHGGVRFLASPAYRARRVRELLRRAAAAAAKRTDDGEQAHAARGVSSSSSK